MCCLQRRLDVFANLREINRTFLNYETFLNKNSRVQLTSSVSRLYREVRTFFVN